MRVRIICIYLFFCIGGASVLKAQNGGEVIVPLSSNPFLFGQPETTTSKTLSSKQFLGKTSQSNRFPFIDYFTINGSEIDVNLWANTDVKKLTRVAVFNAQNSAGATYNGNTGNYGSIDVLMSNNIDLTSSNGQLFAAFNYSTGSTWQAGDSLTLELITSSGNYISVWQSPNANLSNIDVRIPIDLQSITTTNFTFRFRSYSRCLSTNTETFLLHKVVLSDKLELPYYENFTEPDSSNVLFPSRVFWQQAQTGINNQLGLPGTRAVVFDKFDRDSSVYNNNGYADTLHSQPIDLTKFAANDSVFLRFMYQSMPASDNTDSLILEGLNNIGQWIRIWQTGKAASSGYVTFVKQVNFGRFRHSNFQYRLVNKCNYSTNDTMQFIATGFHVGKKLLMPFVDDFSTSILYPSTKYWKDKTVYINNQFPIGAPSVNVATFDGLDAHGNAYGSGRGYLDTLTSVSLNLNGLKRSDSVYLSFYLEPQGLGSDPPNETDSFILEFKSSNFDPSAWQTVWGATVGGYSANQFAKISILVDSVFLNDDFQFRFKNTGSKTGNLNTWHLDYIQLDRGRSQKDGYYDFAITNSLPSLLGKYESMPRKQFNVNPAAYTNTIQSIGLKNNDTTAFPLNFARAIYEPLNSRIDTFRNALGNVGGGTIVSPLMTSTPALTTAASGDSLIFKSKYYVNSNNTIDNITSNDTLTVPTIFSNYYAYDDGSAEAGYGIANKPGAVALGYALDVADTLWGISMFFNQSRSDVSQQSFNIMVWSNIGTNGNGTGEIVLKRTLQSRPTYTNKINGFYYLQFDQPILLPAGQFYIGWEQSNTFILNMGLDENYAKDTTGINGNMYFKIDELGIWERTKAKGALMMRPIVGKWINPPVGIVEVEQKMNEFNVVVYPNPASDEIFITGTQHDVNVEVYDIAGRMIAVNSNHEKNVHLPQVSRGVYFVKVKDIPTGNTQVKKLLINQ